MSYVRYFAFETCVSFCTIMYPTICPSFTVVVFYFFVNDVWWKQLFYNWGLGTNKETKTDKIFLTFMGPCIVNVFYQVYQQDATLYNILYYCQCSTCFRRYLRPSSGAQNYTHSIQYMSSLLAATASSSSKQAWHILDVLSSWWWAEIMPETCRALAVIKNIV